MLLLNSLGLQDAIERTPINLAHFFSRCLTTASDCAKVIRDALAPHGYLQYSPISHFIQGSYAVLNLLKLSRPEFQTLLDCRDQCITLAREVTEQLERVSIDSEHNPGIFAAFLKKAISNRLAEDEGASASTADVSRDSFFPAGSKFAIDDFSVPETRNEPPATLN